MSGVYLDWHVADLAFREDIRRKAMSAMIRFYVAAAVAHPFSRDIAGYWQRNKPPRTLGWDGRDMVFRGWAWRE